MFSNNLRIVISSAVFLIGCLNTKLYANDEILEEIIVTAQRRDQTLQDVPVSVAVVSGDKILEQGYDRLADLSAFTPNFTLNESATGNEIRIRGFGTSTLNSTAFEQAVATFIDGVYFGRETQSFNVLLDTERVEVLRGPQTTYFGQSAIAGALNIVTRQPNMEALEGFAKIASGENGDARLQAAIGGPITNSLGVRIAGAWRDFDGWAKNAVTGDDAMGQESLTGRVSFLWRPTENMDAKFKYELGKSDFTPGNAHIVNCSTVPVTACRVQDSVLPGVDSFDAANDGVSSFGGSLSAGGRVFLAFGAPRRGVDLTPLWGADLNYRDWGKLDGVRTIEQDSQTLEINYRVGEYLLTYTTGASWAKNSAHGAGDLDFTGFFLHQQAGGVEYNTDSHELRITSMGGEIVDLMAGVYFQRGTTDYAFGQLQGWNGNAAPPPYPTTGMGADRFYHEKQSYLSGFTAATWNASNDIAMDLGVRYMEVEKHGEACQHLLSIQPAMLGSPISVVVPGCTIIGTNWNKGSYNDTNWDYSATVRYILSDSVNLYAKYTDGYKAGGFNSLWVNDPSFFDFNPEEVGAYELGAKGRFLDQRLSVNLALFSMNYTDLQVTGRFDLPTGSVFPILNVAEATSQGIELDAQWAANDTISFGSAIAILDATYDSFPGATCLNIEGVFGYKGCAFGPGNTLDRAGETLPFSPEWSTSFLINYRTPISENMELNLNGDISVSECYYCNYTLNFSGDDTYDIVNLRASIGQISGLWELSIYGRNVTDSRPVTQPNTVPYGEPMTLFNQAVTRGSNYGLELQYNF